jgi:hypothetical protein
VFRFCVPSTFTRDGLTVVPNRTAPRLRLITACWTPHARSFEVGAGALLQECVCEPDIDPDDRAAVERAIREDGPEIAQCRTGSALTKYKADFPEMDRFLALTCWASQAPSRWSRSRSAPGRLDDPNFRCSLRDR